MKEKQEQEGEVKQTPEKLPASVHFMCGWPLLLVVLGGAIGGLMGGLAYGVNMYIYKSKLPAGAKIALNIITGCAAIMIWLLIAVALGATVFKK